MQQIRPIFKREFLGYFRSPVAYVFLNAFLVISVSLAFSRYGGFFKGGVASMESYFMFFPWLFLFIVPAVGMRLWSEEKRSGTVELLFTLPITTLETVLGKFLAGWAFLTLAIALSFTMVLTLTYLGQPDWGVIASTYLGAILMAGSYLGVCSLASALTKSQVISFVLGLLACAMLLFLGLGSFTDFLENVLPVPVAGALSNFSFITHFDAFTMGIIDPKDVVFFLSLTGFTLFLNVVVLERSTALAPSIRFGYKTVSLVLLFIGLVLVNFLASSLPLRLDLTAESNYSLSPGTRMILGKIDEPMALELYFSKDANSLPIAYKNYAARVQEMLRQYVRAAHGKLILKLINPRPDTPEEEKATLAGLTPQIPKQGGEQFFFGLVVTQAEQQRNIPVFTPQREPQLEYDLSKLVYSVQQFDKRKLGLLTGLPLQGNGLSPQIMQMMHQPPQPEQFVVGEWAQAFQIVKIEPASAELPVGLDALAIIHPQNIPPGLQFSIDQFLLGGKPVFLAVDPVSQYSKAPGGPLAMINGPVGGASSDLPGLLDAYGVVYDPQYVVGDPENAIQVQTGGGRVARNPAWLSLGRANFNAKSPPTAQLKSAIFIEAGSIAPKPGSALTFTPLIETSDQAGFISSALLQLAQPDDIAKQIKPSGKLTIAALVTGKFKTAFPEGAPPANKTRGPAKADEKADNPTAIRSALKESAGTSTLFVIADTDWIFDDYSVRKFSYFGQTAAEPINDNLALAANVVEFLGGSPDLISIRGKGSSLHPFEVVRHMEAEAHKKYQEKIAGLDARLVTVQKQLAEIQGKKTDGKHLIATPEVAKLVADFQKQQAALRGERREIRLALRENIDALENHLLILNLVASPLLVGIFGIWFYRSRKK